MKVLGLSFFYHDSAASLIIDGKIIAAVQEERFTRKKNDSAFPINSIRFCLEHANLSPTDIDFIVFYEKPVLKFFRIIETYIDHFPWGFFSFIKTFNTWVKEKLFLNSYLLKELKKIGFDKNIDERILFSEHHLSHAASAYYPSPYKDAVVLTIDAVGEWATTSIAVAKNNELKIIREQHFPHSLGLLYSAFTFFLGFKVNSGEYKLMGLAPYGQPKYKHIIMDNLISLNDDGSFKLNLKYFSFCTSLTMINKNFENLFGISKRKPDSEIKQIHMDIAASIQLVLEDIILKIAGYSAKITKNKNLCLAGGVALNCVANGVLLKSKLFENIWVQPASGDAGGSTGAALFAYHKLTKSKRVNDYVYDGMQGSYLGPSYSEKTIEEFLKNNKIKYQYISNNHDLCNLIAKYLSKNKVIGWFQGRMEFGPRALGNRSILANPLEPKMQELVNLKIKFREGFRPFAPSVLFEKSKEWFDFEGKSPYMTFVCKINDSKKNKFSETNINGFERLKINRSKIPAVTHVDFSSRIQTVEKQQNEKYYNLLRSFYMITKCPILLNTSFNVRGEPIVCTPNDAYNCFIKTNLDILVLGNFIIKK